MLLNDETGIVNKPRPAAPLFQGFAEPFARDPASGGWFDANGNAVPPDIAAQWWQTQSGNGPPLPDFSTFPDLSNVGGGYAPTDGSTGLNPGFGDSQLGAPGTVNPWPDGTRTNADGSGTLPNGTIVSAADMKLALDQYRQAIAKSNTQYDSILGHNPDPSPSSVLGKPTGSTVDTSKVSQVAAGERVGSQVDPSKVSTVAPGERVGSQVDATKVAQVGAAERLGSMVDPSKVATMSPAERLQAAMGRTTTVQGTQFDAAQADQARALGLQNIQDLQATAQGAGAGQLAAQARLKLALLRSSELATGMAAQARGSERRGLRREAMLEGSRRGLEGALAGEAQAAQDRMTAQGQLSGAIQATRTTDVDVAAKRADLSQQRQNLQAQIDAARASGDQNAINTLTAKMADLDQQTKAFNASAANTTQARAEDQAFAGQKTNIEVGQRTKEVNAAAANTAQSRAEEQAFAGQQSGADRDQQGRLYNAGATNASQARSEDQAFAGQQSGADRELRAGEFNAGATNAAQARLEGQAFEGQQVDINRGLEVSRLTEEQRVANERLKLDASKAAQDAAAGLLTENARQEQLAFARTQLAQTKSVEDRKFWGQIISSLLSGAATVAAAPATSDRRAKKDIKPVSDEDLGALAQAVRKSLATWKYKQASDGPPGERAGPMAQDLEKTRLGRAVTSERDDGTKQVDYAQLATLLAAATVKARKREAR